MQPAKHEVRNAYQSGAKYYDFAVKWLYRLIGIRTAYRVRAVELLSLKRGDCVVELGCGTGLNFQLIMEKIGPEGRLIGVDISSKMLEYAKQKAERFGWNNVELVEADITAYDFPKKVNGVFSVGVFGYISEYDRLIKKIATALSPDGKLVIMDGKQPERWSVWFKFVLWLSRSYGVTPSYGDLRPWEAVGRYFKDTSFDEIYNGAMYIASGATPKKEE